MQLELDIKTESVTRRSDWGWLNTQIEALEDTVKGSLQ